MINAVKLLREIHILDRRRDRIGITFFCDLLPRDLLNLFQMRTDDALCLLFIACCRKQSRNISPHLIPHLQFECLIFLSITVGDHMKTKDFTGVILLQMPALPYEDK